MLDVKFTGDPVEAALEEEALPAVKVAVREECTVTLTDRFAATPSASMYAKVTV
jgi:hypothetical protein